VLERDRHGNSSLFRFIFYSDSIATATPDLLDEVRAEARRARTAARALTDDGVAAALHGAAEQLAARRAQVLTANEQDVAAATGRLDEGALDRLHLTPARLDDLEQQLEALAELPPIDRELESWTLENDLQVSVRKIPVGVVGANFEARPAVALDIASQLLKSLNGCVLRTGGAALGTVTVLIDAVLRPSLEAAGLTPDAVGLVRTETHSGADALVSLPDDVPLVILRGSGETTRRLGKVAAEHGVQVLAHADGGGVLYVDREADLDRAERVIRASLDRLGVCNRLNLLLVHESLGVDRFATLLHALGLATYGASDVDLRHEWANDPEHVASVTCHVVAGAEEAAAIANESTSGLAAAIVTEDEQAARRFLDAYRGTAGFWNAPTRFADGYALTGTPETGINVGWSPGPRGPVTYRDLWLRQYRVVGDGSQHR
jgi:glutamate-5-semialdehyde dehydrogenase